jgi:hypothetical protein
VPFFKSCGEKFKAVKFRDRFKRKKCRENGVILISIPYWLPQSKWKTLIKKKTKFLNY